MLARAPGAASETPPVAVRLAPAPRSHGLGRGAGPAESGGAHSQGPQGGSPSFPGSSRSGRGGVSLAGWGSSAFHRDRFVRPSASRADRPSLGFSTSPLRLPPDLQPPPARRLPPPPSPIPLPLSFHLPPTFSFSLPSLDVSSESSLSLSAPQPLIRGLPGWCARSEVPRAWAAVPAPSGRPSRAQPHRPAAPSAPEPRAHGPRARPQGGRRPPGRRQHLHPRGSPLGLSANEPCALNPGRKFR